MIKHLGKYKLFFSHGGVFQPYMKHFLHTNIKSNINLPKALRFG